MFVRMLPESWQSIIQLAVRFMAGHYYRASGSRGFLDHPSARGTFHSLINRVFQTIAYVHLTVWGVQISKYVKNYSLLRGFPRFRPDWIHWFHSFYSTTSEKNCLRAPEVKKKKKKIEIWWFLYRIPCISARYERWCSKKNPVSLVEGVFWSIISRRYVILMA